MIKKKGAEEKKKYLEKNKFTEKNDKMKREDGEKKSLRKEQTRKSGGGFARLNVNSCLYIQTFIFYL